MKSDEQLRAALSGTGLPVKPYEYKGTKPEYIVYNEEDERGAAHADDRPQAMSVWWQVHLFAPVISDYRKRKREIRGMLLDAGFALGAIRTIYEQETETMHVVISCNIMEDMEE